MLDLPEFFEVLEMIPWPVYAICMGSVLATIVTVLFSRKVSANKLNKLDGETLKRKAAHLRYVERGLTDHALFCQGAGSSGPFDLFDVEEAATLEGQVRVPSYLAIVIGADVDEKAPFCHVDADRVSRVLQSNGYKVCCVTTKTTPPTSVNLASTLKKLQGLGRVWDRVVVFVAASFRRVMVPKDVLEDIGSTATGIQMHYFEFLSEESQAEHETAWIDLTVLLSRINQCVKTTQSVTLLLDVSFDEKASDGAPLRQMIDDAVLKARGRFAVLGCTRRYEMTDSSEGHSKMPQSNGSLFAKELCSCLQLSAASKERSAFSNDIAALYDCTNALPVVSGTTATSGYHCGYATVETLWHHMVMSPLGRSILPFWFAYTYVAPIIVSQPAIAPRIAAPRCLGHWRVDRKVLMTQLHKALVPGSGIRFVTLVGPEGSGKTEVMRDAAWDCHLLRKYEGCVFYTDLDSVRKTPRFLRSLCTQTLGPAEAEAEYCSVVQHLCHVISSFDGTLQTEAEATTMLHGNLASLETALLMFDHVDPEKNESDVMLLRGLRALQNAKKLPNSSIVVVLAMAEDAARTPSQPEKSCVTIAVPPLTSEEAAAMLSACGERFGEQTETSAAEGISRNAWVIRVAAGMEGALPDCIDEATVAARAIEQCTEEERNALIQVLTSEVVAVATRHISVEAFFIHTGSRIMSSCVALVQRLARRGLLFLYVGSSSSSTSPSATTSALCVAVNPIIARVLVAHHIPEDPASPQFLNQAAQTVFRRYQRFKGTLTISTVIDDGYYFPNVAHLAATTAAGDSDAAGQATKLLEGLFKSHKFLQWVTAKCSVLDVSAALSRAGWDGNLLSWYLRMRCVFTAHPWELQQHLLFYVLWKKSAVSSDALPFPDLLTEVQQLHPVLFDVTPPNTTVPTEPQYASDVMLVPLEKDTQQVLNLLGFVSSSASPIGPPKLAAVTALMFFSADRLIVGRQDGSVSIIDPRDGSDITPEAMAKAGPSLHGAAVTNIMMNHDGRCVTASRSPRRILLWEADFSASKVLEVLERPPKSERGEEHSQWTHRAAIVAAGVDFRCVMVRPDTTEATRNTCILYVGPATAASMGGDSDHAPENNISFTGAEEHLMCRATLTLPPSSPHRLTAACAGAVAEGKEAAPTKPCLRVAVGTSAGTVIQFHVVQEDEREDVNVSKK